jgi:c(7)-type cytochrome triheme protein
MNRLQAAPIVFLLACIGAVLLVANGMPQQAATTDETYDEGEYGPRAPIVWATPVQAMFSHQSHTTMGFSCDDCHFEPFEMEQGAVLEADDFTMAFFAEGKYCGQ